MATPATSIWKDLLDLIRSKLDEYHFAGENQYFMNTIPHMYLEKQGMAVIKVVVFESLTKCNRGQRREASPPRGYFEPETYNSDTIQI